MALEQVLSDRDSEDEVDDDIADLEDRRVSLKAFQIHFSFSLFPLLSMSKYCIWICYFKAQFVKNGNMIKFSIALHCQVKFYWHYALPFRVLKNSLFSLVLPYSSCSSRSCAVFYWIFTVQQTYINHDNLMLNCNVADAWRFCGCFQRWKTAHASLELFYEEAKVSNAGSHINLSLVFFSPH